MTIDEERKVRDELNRAILGLGFLTLFELGTISYLHLHTPLINGPELGSSFQTVLVDFLVFTR
jgi:hypothetical protein